MDQSPLIVAALLLLAPAFAGAANHYVTQNGVGSNSGADWSNACAGFSGTCAPSSMVRGDTYYVATGNYGSYTFDKAASGAQYITIKKATTADHGSTDPGWQGSYGTGQAMFGGLSFTSPYWVFDGVTGGGPGNWTSGHGFLIEGHVDISQTPTDSSINIKHTELRYGPGWSTSTSKTDAIYAPGTHNNLYFSYNYIHQFPRAGWLLRYGDNAVIEYNYVEDVCAEFDIDGTHCEHIVMYDFNNGIFRYNILKGIKSTGGIAVNDGNSDNWAVYGNVFYNSPADSASCAISIVSGDTATNWKVINNDFIGLNSKVYMQGSNNVLYNNIFYRSDARFTLDIGGTYDYNYYSDFSDILCAFTPAAHEPPKTGPPRATSCATTSVNSNPFVDWQNANFNLVSPLTNWAGLNICSILTCNSQYSYNIDMLGNVRGADGTWDRGAIEYVSGASNYHPADTSKDWALSTSEVSVYNLCWKTPTCTPSPATTYVSNANLMWKSRVDGAYHYAGGSCPLCWVSGA